jgi:parallel beta-helix repeat protein
MKKILFLLSVLPVMALSQTRIPITNNMTIGSNSNIKFIPGNYVFSDPEQNGVIQIDGQHDIILDGDSCTVDGTTYQGYMIKINNSQNIVIKNFDSVFKYKYAVYVTNSSYIQMFGNCFSRNKVDSIGWINVWADYLLALGGGVMMYQSRGADIYDNVMKYQNDGVALYHCDSIRIHNNDFAWNTSYGIRMFWTDSCDIYENVANHINRPFTDPSDCAALLMIISNENRVVNNDLSYSGDGVFLGQYEHSDILNNNYFAWNECSYSPHNAIEATFADGNVYKHNNCNFSHYGFWLGYSFNSLVDSNEITGNFNSGIAIDRGFNNTITNNHIMQNPLGIELWEGSPISGYENQSSHDYFIRDNVIERNTIGISAKHSEHSVITGNAFLYNQNQSIFLESLSLLDTITGNDFRLPTIQHIKNNSVNDIYAMNNSFEPNDTAMISAKIYDKHDNASRGYVNWYPPVPGPPPAIQYNPPCDMAEPGSLWYAYPEIGYGLRMDETVTFDTAEKKVGAASVKLVTGRGWYVALNYRPGGDSLSQWSLAEEDTLYFWVRTIKQPQFGFQYFHIRIGDAYGNYYRYTASSYLLNAANLVWIQYMFPLSGNSQFTRTSSGTMDLSQTNYVEIWADTWDYGFTLWVDGVQFSLCDPPVTGTPDMYPEAGAGLRVYPNPLNGQATIEYTLTRNDHVTLSVYDMRGILVETIVDQNQGKGRHVCQFSPGPGTAGLFILTLTTSSSVQSARMIILE